MFGCLAADVLYWRRIVEWATAVFMIEAHCLATPISLVVSIDADACV